jgi:hypothetical protein
MESILTSFKEEIKTATPASKTNSSRCRARGSGEREG